MSEPFASFKIPEQAVLQDSLPRNDAGKVVKDRPRAATVAQGEKV